MTSNEDRDVRTGRAYPFAQMTNAFVTALTHADADTRWRARGRMSQWRSVLAGMASGRLAIGSRAPVKDLPAWATPVVIRGGFATGAAEAGGELEPWERELARRAGVWETREAVFGYYLTQTGLAELDAMLSSGAYAVRVPEEAALLTVAWLVSVGEKGTAVDLAKALFPFAKQLRFAPMPAEAVTTEPSTVYRETVADARRKLETRRSNDRVETMREALTVWNPLADDVLALWLETVEDGRVARYWSPGWVERADVLLARYRELGATHRRCSKHRKPKENLAILLRSLQTIRSHGDLEPRQAGLLQAAVDSMVARRGAPGSATHQALRRRQAANASRPATKPWLA